MSTSQNTATSIVHGPAAEALRAEQGQSQPVGQGNQAPTTGTVQDFKSNQNSFSDSAKGYAREIAGKVFGKEHEVQQGQAVRRGELSPEEAKATITKENTAV